MRFLNEAMALRQSGWVLLMVSAQDEIRLERMKVRGDRLAADMLNHASEQEVERIRADIRGWKLLTNDGTLEELSENVDSLMRDLKL